MSKTTITVYELERNNFDFGLQDYSIFDENYRPVLNSAILDFYRWYEIGYDNPAKWRERINAKLNRIMRDKYNALYEAKKTEFNPLFNIDITETFDHSIKQTGKDNNTTTTDNENETTTNNKNIHSNYPSDEFIENDLSNNLFVDSAQRTDGTTTDKGNETQTSNTETETENIEHYERKQLGSSAGLPFSKALIQLKQFYDKYELDKQVCEELKEFFLLTF